VVVVCAQFSDRVYLPQYIVCNIDRHRTLAGQYCLICSDAFLFGCGACLLVAVVFAGPPTVKQHMVAVKSCHGVNVSMVAYPNLHY